MLHAVGIVSEYNPFHNGHLYHLQQAKVQTGADVSIAIMSGNWLQRGEPAIFDKWQRTKLALDNGIDIVVELPFFRLSNHPIYSHLGQLLWQQTCSAIGCRLARRTPALTIRS